MQAGLDAAYGSASARKPVLKHVAYSTWDEVMDEIQRCCPTVLHLQLFKDMVQPEMMLPSIKAWNEHAGRIGCAQLRVIVVNACGSDEHAQKFAGCVDFEIGHAAPVKDKDALVFSETLYACVCQGMSLAVSFNTARSATSPGYRMYANADPLVTFCPGGAGIDGSEGPSGERARTSGHPMASPREAPPSVHAHPDPAPAPPVVQRLVDDMLVALFATLDSLLEEEHPQKKK